MAWRTNTRPSKSTNTAHGGKLLKSAHVIMAKETRGSLELIDRKIFNFLLSRTIGKNIEPNDGIHSVPVMDVLKFLGHTSTDRLNQSLHRLAAISISIDYVDAKSRKHSVVTHYLSYDLEHNETGSISFAFDKMLLKFLANPKVFAVLDMATVRGFRSEYAARLYETMALQFGKQHPEWSPSLEEFREHMAVGEAYPRYNNLRARVIDPAINEVNAAAPFSVIMTERRGGRGGKIIGLNFRAAPKSSASLSTVGDVARRGLLSRRKKTPGRDPLTIDLLSNQTDLEKDPLGISEATIKQAIENYGLTDIAPPLQEWRASFKNRPPPAQADMAFLSWLDVYAERLHGEADDPLKNTDPDIISNILDMIGAEDEDD
ncbi:replication initiation protein [Acetobacter malorum]|nr:replication initiation protein [Acetobacter malorum]KXV09884.1 hypothetical protein AD930_02345 [Acetobacter malorum]